MKAKKEPLKLVPGKKATTRPRRTAAQIRAEEDRQDLEDARQRLAEHRAKMQAGGDLSDYPTLDDLRRALKK